MYNPSIILNIRLTSTQIVTASLGFPTHYITIGERNTRITGPPTLKQQCSYLIIHILYSHSPLIHIWLQTKPFGYKIGRLGNSFRHQWNLERRSL